MPAVAHASPSRHGDAPAVDCERLVVRYGERTAVDGLSLTAGPGEVVALLGPNGAGKTSTVECLEGYRRPAAGRIRVLGLDPLAEHRALVPRIGVMLQRGGVYPMLGPRQILRLFAGYYHDPASPDELLELVSLADAARTPWRHLSGGEQARLSLALALVGRPDVVFLDEPTAGVDPEGRLGVRDVVGSLRDRGVCVLLTTHELAEAERLADRVVILHRGRVAAAGTPAELAATAGAGGPALTFGASARLDVAALGRELGAEVTEEEPGRYRVAASPSPALTAALAAWLVERDVGLTDLRAGRSLEEVYLAMIGARRAGGDGSGSFDVSGSGEGSGSGGPRRDGRRRRRAGSGRRRPGSRDDRAGSRRGRSGSRADRE